MVAHQEHPRARGENFLDESKIAIIVGTSPRTRGKHKIFRVKFAHVRNIPAHAGKTPKGRKCRLTDEEHPRARGENTY